MPNLRKGIKLLQEQEGVGPPVKKGDEVRYEYDLFLNGGDHIRSESKATTVVGKRQLIAGIESTLEGMKKGGERKVKISPHLAYRDRGLPAANIPPDAVLIFHVRILDIKKASG